MVESYCWFISVLEKLVTNDKFAYYPKYIISFPDDVIIITCLYSTVVNLYKCFFTKRVKVSLIINMAKITEG